VAAPRRFFNGDLPMFQILASVQVINPKHPRFEQAGVIFANPENPKKVEVRFDSDFEVETVAVADLKGL
jgi:hypothetical protein